MFVINPCAAGCGRLAITGGNLCFIHQAKPEEETQRICAYINQNKTINDLCVAGMRFENVDFSNHKFDGCNFRDTFFIKCNLSGSGIMTSFFDFAEFKECDFSKSDIQFTSFAGGRFNKCAFEDCEIISVNYEGATVAESSFNNSNLYNSRFISADLENTTFINCNLKRVYFISAKRNEKLFKASNTAEALFEPEDR